MKLESPFRAVLYGTLVVGTLDALDAIVNGTTIHMLGVGLPSAWFASRVPR